MTTSRPVRSSESASASQSNGYRVRGSNTSTEMVPSSSSATASASCTRWPTATTVTSVPGRCTRATPSGIGANVSKSTFSRRDTASAGANRITGSSSRMAVSSRP